MKNTVNLRIPVVLCLALVLGILLAYAACRTGISWLCFLLCIPVFAVIIIAVAARGKGIYCVVVLALAAVFMTTGLVYASLLIESRSIDNSPDGESCVVGTVQSLVIGDDERQITLNDVTVNGVSLGAKLLVTITGTGGELCDEGDTVRFTAEIEKIDFITYGSVNSHVIEDVCYKCTVYYGLEAESGFSLLGTVRSYVREKLYDALDDSTAGVIYALLTGDDGGAEEGILDAFRYGGVAHVFAVSGLHIGVVYGALRSLCLLLKRRGVVSSVVCIAAIIAYSALCGFTVSSVRAVIMCSVSAVCRHTGKKYDTLNSLAFSVILILLANPLDLFSTGFKLSVLAVCGIAMYIAVFRKRLSFMPFNTGEGLAVTLAAQAGTIPASLSSFGYLSAAGLLLNFIIIPVLSAAFVLMLVGVILSFIIFPLSEAIIGLCALPIEAIISLIVLGGFEKAAVFGIGGKLFTVLYVIFAVLLSDKINNGKMAKIIIAALAVFTAVVYAFVAAYYPLNGTYIAVSACYGGGYVLFKNSGGSVLVITDGVAEYKLTAFLSSCGESGCTAVVILGGESCAEFIYSLDVKTERVYVCGAYLAADAYGEAEFMTKDAFSECGISFYFTDGYTLMAEANGVKTGICGGETVPDGCDLLVGDINFKEAEAEGYSVNFSGGDADRCVYTDGTQTFTARAKLSRSYVF